MKCRHCHAPLDRVFADLGHAPPSNAYLSAEDLRKPEVHYPLRVMVCGRCWLVQAEEYASAQDLFTKDYAYFSSVSSSWLAHAERYAEMIIPRMGLTSDSFVIEIGSNDGYLLRNFVKHGIPCLGIEPTAGTAAAAERSGVPSLVEFFGTDLVRSAPPGLRMADLICGNNVYAHVPDINDFTGAIRLALKPQGVVTLEFPHLLQLVEHGQFDTIYHEHFSYLSLLVVADIFKSHGLRVFDVEELPTHGGSLRIYGCHTDADHEETSDVGRVLTAEMMRGMDTERYYSAFQERTERTKAAFLGLLLDAKRSGRSVAGYGAAAKANTLLNFSGVRKDLLPVIYDAAPSKQGMFMPGSHIPILSPERLADDRPDLLIALPWNLLDEIRTQYTDVLDRGTELVTVIPDVQYWTAQGH